MARHILFPSVSNGKQNVRCIVGSTNGPLCNALCDKWFFRLALHNFSAFHFLPQLREISTTLTLWWCTMRWPICRLRDLRQSSRFSAISFRVYLSVETHCCICFLLSCRRCLRRPLLYCPAAVGSLYTFLSWSGGTNTHHLLSASIPHGPADHGNLGHQGQKQGWPISGSYARTLGNHMCQLWQVESIFCEVRL